MPNPDFAVILCSTEISIAAARAWSRIGGYADAGQFLDVESVLTAGEGGLGSVRRIGEPILEVMVGASAYSYTYAQIVGPMSKYAYHGCVLLTPLSNESCTLTYMLTYDQSPLLEGERATQYAKLSSRFKAASDRMKLFAELEDQGAE